MADPTISRAELARLQAIETSAEPVIEESDLGEPTPSISRRELQGLVGMIGNQLNDRLVGEPGDPTRPGREEAVNTLGRGVGSVAETALQLAGLTAGQESGAGLGGMIGQAITPLPLKPAGRLVGTMLGSALGFGATDAAIDTAKGEPVSVDPVGTTLAAGTPALPLIAKTVGTYGGGAVRSVRDTLSAGGRAVYDRIANVIDPPGNFAAAFGSTIDDFNIQGRVQNGVSRTPADALVRMDKRGVFSSTPGGKVPTDFSLLRARFQAEKARLVGGLDDVKAPLEPQAIPLSGVVGTKAKEISQTLEQTATVGDIEKSWTSLLSKYTDSTGTGKVAGDAERIVAREIEKLKTLGLKPDDLKKRQTALETIKLTESYLSGRALRPASSLGDGEVRKLLGVVPGKGGQWDTEKARRYISYENAKQVVLETDELARSAQIPFELLYRKRISLDKLAQYGPEAADSPVATQVMTDLSSAVRGFENDLALKAGETGKAFLKAKDELADVFTVEDRVFRAEAASRSPKNFTQALSFAPTAIAARNVARGMASSRFRLTRSNIGKLIRDNPTPSFQVQLPEKVEKLISMSGTVSRNVSNFFGDMAAREHARTLIPNAIVNGIVLQTLSERGISDVDEMEIEQIAQDPGFQGLVQSARAEVSQSMMGFNEALNREDEGALAMEVANLSKRYPGAFDPGKTGIPGEVTLNGKTRFPFPEDAQLYAGKVRAADEIDVMEKAKIISELNKSGTVLTVPSSLRPKKVTFPDEYSSYL